MSPLYQSPSPENLLIGAGDLYLDRIVGGLKTGLRHVGNVELLERTIEDTNLDKYSSMRAARPLYARRLSRRLTSIRFQFDEFGYRNVAMLSMGVATVNAQTADPVVAEVLFADVPAAALGAVLGGATFRVSKFGAISAISVDVGATPLVAGTDYTVDLARGTITILAASVVVTNDTDDLTVDYTPTAITELPQIGLGTESFIEVGGLFVPDPTTGPKLMLEWWRASLTPDGPMGFISEEWSAATMVAALQDDSAGGYGGSAAYPLARITVM